MLSKINLRGDWRTRRVWVNGRQLFPGPSLKVQNHSPDGFNWGYGGSGPAQLALAVLLKCVGRDLALRHYQDFKWRFLAPLPGGDFAVTIDLGAFLEENEDSMKLRAPEPD
jgi:hypothetical protein